MKKYSASIEDNQMTRLTKFSYTGLLISVILLGCSALSDNAPKNEKNKRTEAKEKQWVLSNQSGEKASDSSLMMRVKDMVKSEEVDFSAYDGRSYKNADIWHHDDTEKLRDNVTYRRANELIKQGNYREAKDVLVGIVNTSPQSSTVWRNLGDCYYNLLELSSAISAYEKALSINRENYFALRGAAFAHLYYGHDLWSAKDRAHAHSEYGSALKALQQCMRIYPGDAEAMYGRAMAAEGASRRLYQNALALLAKGDTRQAAAAARNCFEIIDEGTEAARQRINKSKDKNEIGPRNVLGGLFQRRAMLCRSMQHNEQAEQSISQAIRAYESILKIAPDNVLAKKELKKCQTLDEQWGKQQSGSK